MEDKTPVYDAVRDSPVTKNHYGSLVIIAFIAFVWVIFGVIPDAHSRGGGSSGGHSSSVGHASVSESSHSSVSESSHAETESVGSSEDANSPAFHSPVFVPHSVSRTVPADGGPNDSTDDYSWWFLFGGLGLLLFVIGMIALST